MNKSRIFISIDSLSYLETKRFREFLHSPYFNKESELTALFDLIRFRQGSPAWQIDRHLPEITPITIESRKDLHLHLFPERPFDDTNIRRMLSVLQKHLLHFWANESLKANPLRTALIQLPVIRQKELEDLYQYEFQKAHQTALQSHVHDSFDLLNLHLLATEYQQFIEARKDRSASNTIEPAIQTLDTFYFAHKLRHLCAALNQNAILHTRIQTGLETELIDHLKASSLPQTPAIQVYFAIYHMLSHPEQENFYTQVTEQLSKYAPQFTASEAREMYAYAQNYCIQRINEGKPEYLSRLFQLYQSLLDREIILEKGQISPWDFKNIVTVALRLDAHQWAEQFIQQFSPKIEIRFRENAHNYNMARLAYSRGYYSSVLRLLNMVDYDDIFYALDSRVLLLKTYFELDELDPLYSLMDSFRVFLHRNRSLSDRHRNTYLNLIKLTKKLTKIRPSEQAKLKKLQQEINQTSQIADAKWLQEKIEKLLDR